MSTQLFDEILEKNQLVKGRLNLNKADLEKLYRALEKDNNRLKKKQARQEEIIKTNITERNKINSQIKRNLESVQKSFYPSTNKISLLYKKQGENYYVKATSNSLFFLHVYPFFCSSFLLSIYSINSERDPTNYTLFLPWKKRFGQLLITPIGHHFCAPNSRILCQLDPCPEPLIALPRRTWQAFAILFYQDT